MGMDLEAGADGSGIQDGKSAEGLGVLAGLVAMVDRRHERVAGGGARRAVKLTGREQGRRPCE